MPVMVFSNYASCSVLRGARRGEWLLRHVQRRVQLTLRLRRGETGAGLPAAAADDLPAAVLGLQGLGGERDHLARRRAGEDHVDTAGAGAHLQLCEQRLAVARARRHEGGGIDDRQRSEEHTSELQSLAY